MADGTKKLIINLSENHPIFELEEEQRDGKAREIIDFFYQDGQKIKDRLEELNLKIAVLATNMEAINEVLTTVREIKQKISPESLLPPENIQAPMEQTIKEKNYFLPQENKQEKAPEKSEQRTVQVDVDAFFDL